MTLPDLEAWAIFASVAEHGSFARTAEALALSKPTISKAVSRLEGQLGVALLSRTSRQISLTETGRHVLGHASRLLSEAYSAESLARAGRLLPAGVVRMAAPMTFGVQHLSPLLPDFFSQYPEIDLTIDFNDAVIDLVAEGHDLALRIAALADSSLKARKLCTVRLLVVATPDWAQRTPLGPHPRDLMQHKGFVYTSTPAPGTIKLSHASGETYVLAQTARLRANNAEAFLPALLAGQGYAVLPEFMVWDAVQSGQLQVLYPAWQSDPIALYLVTPPSSLRPLRVTVLLDYLAQRLAAVPWAS